jgi:hypothetical protein
VPKRCEAVHTRRELDEAGLAFLIQRHCAAPYASRAIVAAVSGDK